MEVFTKTMIYALKAFQIDKICCYLFEERSLSNYDIKFREYNFFYRILRNNNYCNLPFLYFFCNFCVMLNFFNLLSKSTLFREGNKNF
jgi:hypothetical protein